MIANSNLAFEFLPKNHCVVQMDPKSPCIPNDMAGNEGLWWSGFHPVEKVTEVSLLECGASRGLTCISAYVLQQSC